MRFALDSGIGQFNVESEPELRALDGVGRALGRRAVQQQQGRADAIGAVQGRRADAQGKGGAVFHSGFGHRQQRPVAENARCAAIETARQAP